MKAICIAIILSAFTCPTWSAESKLQLDLGAGTSIDLIHIPAGEFNRGSPSDEPGRSTDEIQNTVRLSADFYISRTSITRGQWERFITETQYRTEAEIGTSGGYGWDGNALTQRKEFTWKSPGFQQDRSNPVCLVTYNDALTFCQWLEKKIHRKTKLPTEAQWEYACRAGTTTPWPTGIEPGTWHKGNSRNSTHPVDSNAPNAWDLIIGGNVSDWCLDWYAPYDASSLTNPLQENPNLSDKPRRVLRGGSWNRDVKNTRSAARFRADPKSRNADIGFRIVCATSETQPLSAPPVSSMVPPLAEDPSPQTTPSNDIPSDSYEPQNIHSDSKSPLGKIALLLIPIGAVILIIRAAFRNRTQIGPSELESPSNSFTRSASSANIHPTTRLTENGFWVQSNCPVGSALFLSYMVNGINEQHSVIYQPGANGQFIFTGQRPDSVSVSESDNLPPPLSDQQLPPQTMFQRDDDNFQGGFQPSRHPSAY